MPSSAMNSTVQQFDEDQSHVQPAVVMDRLNVPRYMQNFEIYSQHIALY